MFIFTVLNTSHEPKTQNNLRLPDLTIAIVPVKRIMCLLIQPHLTLCEQDIQVERRTEKHIPLTLLKLSIPGILYKSGTVCPIVSLLFMTNFL